MGVHDLVHLGSNYFNVFRKRRTKYKDISTASWENVRLI
nr:MAG TPA: hypothetical protein [Bacteriophage sp.]